tara:strand:+ start:381 stop:782 length:402 start_codon:yes stop_codon:yes gene_type:complete
MRKQIFSLFAIMAFTVGAFAEGLFINGDFDAAKKAAKAGDKLVMIDFKADWCGPCKMLDRTTWSDEEVIGSVQEKAVAVKIDVDQNGDLASKYGIRSIPTIIFTDANGEEVSRFIGYRDAEGFLKELDRIGNS